MPQHEGHLGAVSVAVTGNKTLTANDSGIEQVVTANSVVTLPSTVVGLSYTITVGTTSTGGVPTLSVSPAAIDLIVGNGAAGVDDKDLVCSSLRPGDSVSLVANGTSGWIIQSITGTWTREA